MIILFWLGDNYENLNQIANNINQETWKLRKLLFPNFINKHNIDLHHIPQTALATAKITVLIVVTIHDLIPYVLPETTGRGYLEKFLREMPSIISNAKGILTVSEYSKKDILKFFNHISEEKIFVTPLAANSSFKPMDKNHCKKLIQERFNFDKPYILYIGGFSTQKC